MIGSNNSRSVEWIAAVCATTVLFGSGTTHADDARLGTQVVPSFQHIDLRLDPDTDHFSGSVSVDLDVKEATKSFTLHSKGPTIQSLTLIQNDNVLPTEYEYLDYGRLEVRSEKELTARPAKLEITFTNHYDTTAVGLYKTEVEGHGYLFSQMESDEARKAFPCWDEPAFKFPYQLTLAVPDGQLAVSNTPVERESVQDEWRTFEFAKSKPMPSYLIAIAAGPLETVDLPGMSIPGRVVTVKGRSHMTDEAIKSTPRIVAALEEYFGMRYPYEKLDLIAVPEFWPGAMENPGAITFAEALIVLEPDKVTISQKRSFAITAAHELAHMWFGDMVTMEWWDDLWLNESFASWMENKTTHKVFPEYDVDISVVRSVQRAMNTDARPSTRAIRRPVAASDNIMQAADELTYSKGEGVLLMFEQWMGEDVMREGVLDYIQTHAWGNATAQDLWASLAKVSGLDIDAAMSSFLDQPGVPLVSTDVTLDGHVILSQRRFSNYGVDLPDEPLWDIPVTLKYYDGIGTKEMSVLLDQPEMTVSLESEGDLQWVLPNAGMSGYYRWEMPTEMLHTLAANSTKVLDARERVGLLGNLNAQLDAGTISGDEFLRTMNQFAEDSNPQVISTLISSLRKVRFAFVTPDQKDRFAVYVRRTLGPALERYGLEERPGESESVTRFRPQLIGWLGDEGQDPAVRAYADSLTALYFENANAVDPTIAGVALSLSAHHGDRAMFEECKKRFETAEAPRERRRYLGLMGDFRDPELVHEALAYSLEGPLRPTEVFTIPFSIGDADEYEQLVFDWTMDHYDEITGRIPPHFRSFMPFIAGGCSAKRLETAQEFFSQPENNVPGTDEQMAKVADRVTDCVSLREREGQAVATYLTNLATTQ